MALNGGGFRRAFRWFRGRPGTISPATIVAVLVGIAVVGGYAAVRTNGFADTSLLGSGSDLPEIRVYQTFEGTTSATFPEGAAGVVMPAATATGPWSATEVGQVLQRVKAALLASHLDKRMLVNHDTAGFLSLLAPGSRETFKDSKHDSQMIQTAPGATLAALSPRVSGKTTFVSKKESEGARYLEIVTNYVWVYPFAGVSHSPGEKLAVVHDELTWRFYHPADVKQSALGLWAYGGKMYMLNVSCANLQKGLIAAENAPDLDNSTPDDGQDWYDPNQPADAGSDCK